MLRKCLLSILIALLFFIALAFAAEGLPDVIVFKSDEGRVVFRHRKHYERLRRNKCNVCHHASLPDGSDAHKCTECHKSEKTLQGGKEIPDRKKAMHEQCHDCHMKLLTVPLKAGPTVVCKDCHLKTEAGYNVNHGKEKEE